MYHPRFWRNNCKRKIMILFIKYCRIIVFTFIFSHSLTSVAQSADISGTITSFVSIGDAHELSGYFYLNISVKTDNNEGDYSKSQSEVLLTDFFRRNRPLSFTVDSKGSLSGSSEYIIGKYKTSKETFRVYILIKEISSKKLIHQISFEKE